MNVDLSTKGKFLLDKNKINVSDIVSHPRVKVEVDSPHIFGG